MVRRLIWFLFLTTNTNALVTTAIPKTVRRKVEFELNPSIAEIPAKSWNACLAPDGSSSPFLEHAWLCCLEESGCVSPETGWVPQHLSLKIDGKVRGYIPLYVKNHSMGEFIFDDAWAEAAYQNGIKYYPKLLVGVPFTPATGGRIMLHPEIRETFSRQEITNLTVMIGSFLRGLAESNNISSVHFNFVTHDEATDLSGELPHATQVKDEDTSLKSKLKTVLKRIDRNKDDYLRRTSLQYHWTNSNSNNEGKPYKSFEDYLGCFKSKRRINIRRERNKVVQDENVRIDAVEGSDILNHDGLIERMYEIYVSTVNRMFYGRQYLTLEFFQCLVKGDFIHNLCFLCARDKSAGDKLRAEDVFAGTFNIIKDGVFYGRYWGCLPGKELKNLHFECCYWSAIDYCIKNGLKRMEPGAGGGDYKWARGFDPALIHSSHYICHSGLRDAVSQFLDYETENNVEVKEYLLRRSAVSNNRLAN